MAKSILQKSLWLVVWSLLCSVTLQQQQNPPGGYAFINPPPQNDTSDPLKVFDLKSDINIRWSGPEKNVTMRFVQDVPKKDIYNYVFRKRAHSTPSTPTRVMVHSADEGAMGIFIWLYGMANASLIASEDLTNLKGQWLWHVNLTKEMDLTVSKRFYFDLFVEGYTTPSAWSQDFIITTAVTTSATATSSSTTTSSPTNATNTTNTAVPSNNGLSSGAKAGIGIGVAVGVIALLTAAVFFWRSRRGNHNDLTGGGIETSQASGTPYRLVNQGTSEEDYKSSMTNPGLSEAPANEVRPELPGSNEQAFEMADTSVPHR